MKIKVKKIAIYGASGHGKVVADIARLNGYKISYFVDDDKITKSIAVKFKYEPKYFSKFELSEMAKTAEIF